MKKAKHLVKRLLSSALAAAIAMSVTISMTPVRANEAQDDGVQSGSYEGTGVALR